ncbi:MAG: hypothetical protein D6816_03665, partial [Bacteroidetes bacterium]
MAVDFALLEPDELPTAPLRDVKQRLFFRWGGKVNHFAEMCQICFRLFSNNVRPGKFAANGAG